MRVDQRVVACGNRVLPEELFGRNVRTEVAVLRAHVAMGELEPGASERVSELVRVREEAPGDLFIRGIGAQRDVRGEHRRAVLLRRIKRIRYGGIRVFGDPLVRASGTLHEFPFVAEEVLEIVIAPLGGRGRPDNFDTAGDRVRTFAAAVAIRPPETLLGEAGGLGFGTDVGFGGRAMGLAEGVATGNEGDGLLVVHRHACEGFTNVPRRGERVGVAVRPLGVDVDQAHLHGGERFFEIAITGIALVAQPGVLRSPIHVLLRLPDVGPTAAEAEGFEAHRLKCAIAGENHQVGPRDFLAVFLFDRPQEAAGFVEVGVVRPTVKWGEALLSGAGAAATITGAVGARAMPGHADEKRTIVSEVGRPPLLRIRHQCAEITLQGRQVELLELLRVVEVRAHGIGQGGVLVKHFQIELIGPPVAIGPSAGARGRGLWGAAVQVREGAFAAGGSSWVFHGMFEF